MKHNIIYRALAKVGIIQSLAKTSRRKSGQAACPQTLEEFDLKDSLKEPTAFYRSCVAYFDQKLDKRPKAHRAYFSLEQRGFGEDAFHVMWSILVTRYQPVNFLEIGVYRGQVLSLIGLLQKMHGLESNNTGIGPFERIGDADSVKDYGHCPDWLADIKTNIAHFNLPQPKLVKAFSTDTVAVEAIKSTMWDMIYIDGNHDYEVVIDDWENCRKRVKVGGILVLDDSGLNTRYSPPLFATGGFRGPSRVANSVDEVEFREIMQVGHNRAFMRIS